MVTDYNNVIDVMVLYICKLVYIYSFDIVTKCIFHNYV